MRKVLLASLVICMLALLSTLSMSVHATQPTTASGIWTYTPTIILPSVRFADGNMFFEATSEDVWTGTFEGHSHCVERVVIHPSGSWNAEGLCTFESCTVTGESGTLVIHFVGTKPGPTADWSGRWVILSGTGDLANLHGQGTWWGPGAPAPGVEGFVDYSGQIHFDPA